MNATSRQQHKAPGPVTQEDVQKWLVARVAAACSAAADTIDVHQQFEYYGLDSLQAAQISSELENWLGMKLSPTFVWDYPTINLAAQYVTRAVQTRGQNS